MEIFTYKKEYFPSDWSDDDIRDYLSNLQNFLSGMLEILED